MSNPFASDSPPPPAEPKITPPPTMPDPQSPDALAAKRRAQQDVMGRAGRHSTILSTAMSRGERPNSVVGSVGSYMATKLGSGT